MLLLRRTIAALTLTLACVGDQGRAAELWLPPIDGEFSGVFAAPKFPGTPALKWTVNVRTTRSNARVADFAIDGAGTRLRAQVGIDAAGNGWWKLTEAEFDAAEWCVVASREIGGGLTGVAATGKIELSGGGAITDMEPVGSLTLAWREGSVGHEADGWRLEGVSLKGEVAVAEGYSVQSVGPLEFTVRTISTTRFGARNLSIRGALNKDRTLALTEARVEIAGGEVTVDPATITLVPVALELNLRIANIGLQDIAALVPAGLADARGRINGAVQVGWSEAEGFQLGTGNLVLGSTEQAMVRMAPSPGFLTDQVMERFDLLPAWLGPVARWFRPENPAYADMREIELGRTELQVEALSVQLTPDGDREGRSARVRVVARPVREGGVVEVVTFEVNVAGPLAQVLRLGLNQNFSVQTR